MSDLNKLEKRKIEKVLEMGSGYVLNFSNTTFEEFVLESINVSIYDSKYDTYGDSKAKRLRAIWEKESNHTIGNLLSDLLEYRNIEIQCGSFGINVQSEELIQEYKKIADRLKLDSPVENIEAINPINDDKDFALVSKQIRESIDKHHPEAALDRLHTFCIKFFRVLNEKHSIEFTKDLPLQNLVGSYVKELLRLKKIDSVMTERILKSSISVLDAFNKVRNDHSLVHDNPTLNYHESILIFNHVANTIKFIQFIEEEESQEEEPIHPSCETDELPF